MINFAQLLPGLVIISLGLGILVSSVGRGGDIIGAGLVGLGVGWSIFGSYTVHIEQE